MHSVLTMTTPALPERSRAQPPQESGTVEHGRVPVDEGERDVRRLEDRERLYAVAGLANLRHIETGLLDRSSDRAPKDRQVVDDQDRPRAQDACLPGALAPLQIALFAPPARR